MGKRRKLTAVETIVPFFKGKGKQQFKIQISKTEKRPIKSSGGLPFDHFQVELSFF
jgi:hypothetical protein